MAKKIAKIEDCLTMQSLLDEIADKWTVLVMGIISDGPKRFNQIKNSLDGVSQKSLTQCLRRLERNAWSHVQLLTVMFWVLSIL